MTLIQRYRESIQNKKLQSDPAQAVVVEELQKLARLLASHYAWNSTPSLTQRWRIYRQPGVRGMYLHGSVGSGKTMLMDLFYDSLPTEEKMRIHFHRFMREVHHQLRAHQGKKNPLALVAAEFAQKSRVLCLDEFFVEDVADAMILAGLIKGLIRQKMTLVITSNIAPEHLYKNGVQRQRFLPAIALIEKHLLIHNMGQVCDYRLLRMEQLQLYLTPADTKADERLESEFKALSMQPRSSQKSIEIEGRDIPIRAVTEDILWCDFQALCGGPRSAHDYIELAKMYHTVLISQIPQLTEELEDPARRFVHLIDEFYDRRVKVILSAAVPLQDLYKGKKVATAFERTLSRLKEMQTAAYLSLPHRG